MNPDVKPLFKSAESLVNQARRLAARGAHETSEASSRWAEYVMKIAAQYEADDEVGNISGQPYFKTTESGEVMTRWRQLGTDRRWWALTDEWQPTPVLRCFTRRGTKRVFHEQDRIGAEMLKYAHVRLYTKVGVVHRLMAQTLMEPKPFDNAVVRHKNDDGFDCSLANLEWGTTADNAVDKYENYKRRAEEILADPDLIEQIRASRKSPRQLAAQYKTYTKFMKLVKSRKAPREKLEEFLEGRRVKKTRRGRPPSEPLTVEERKLIEELVKIPKHTEEAITKLFEFHELTASSRYTLARKRLRRAREAKFESQRLRHLRSAATHCVKALRQR